MFIIFSVVALMSVHAADVDTSTSKSQADGRTQMLWNNVKDGHDEMFFWPIWTARSEKDMADLKANDLSFGDVVPRSLSWDNLREQKPVSVKDNSDEDMFFWPIWTKNERPEAPKDASKNIVWSPEFWLPRSATEKSDADVKVENRNLAEGPNHKDDSKGMWFWYNSREEKPFSVKGDSGDMFFWPIWTKNEKSDADVKVENRNLAEGPNHKDDSKGMWFWYNSREEKPVSVKDDSGDMFFWPIWTKNEKIDAAETVIV